MLYGITSWPWVFRRAFIGIPSDLGSAKLYHPSPGSVAWYVTNPAAGSITTAGSDYFFTPAVDFYGHCYVVGQHDKARCMIPFWVVPDYQPLYTRDWPSVEPTFRIYPSVTIATMDSSAHIRPRSGAWDFEDVIRPPSIGLPYDYFGLLTIQDDFGFSGNYISPASYPFAGALQRTITVTGADASGTMDISGSVDQSLPAVFHLLIDATPFGCPPNTWAVVNVASGELGTSITSSSSTDTTFHCTVPGRYTVLATDAWDCFAVDLSVTPTLSP